MRLRAVLLPLALVLAVGLGVAVFFARRASVERRKAQKERDLIVAMTRDRLESLASIIKEARTEDLTLPTTEKLTPQESGIDVLLDGLRKQRADHPTTGFEWVHAGGFISGNHVSTFLAVDDKDPWGNPLLYRCPGEFHHHGWDLFSRGAPGDDDPIVVGEDLAPVTSGS